MNRQQQFHLLIWFSNVQRSITVVPNRGNRYLLLDQGKVLGELRFDRNFNCISNTCGLDTVFIEQVQSGIRQQR